MTSHELEQQFQALHAEVGQILAAEQKESGLAKEVANLKHAIDALTKEKHDEATVFAWVYPMAVIFLGLTMIATVIGVFMLHGIWGVPIPDAYVAIGAASVAALAGLVSIPSKK